MGDTDHRRTPGALAGGPGRDRDEVRGGSGAVVGAHEDLHRGALAEVRVDPLLVDLHRVEVLPDAGVGRAAVLAARRRALLVDAAAERLAVDADGHVEPRVPAGLAD